MRTPVALLAAAGAVALVAGCGGGEPPMPPACLTDDVTYARALRAAPGDVRLEGRTPISECVRRVRDDGELQTLGLTLAAVADDLAARAQRDGDATAAARLGYLVGAVQRRSTGVTQQVARSMEITGARVLRLEDDTLSAAVEAGRAAGRARG